MSMLRHPDFLYIAFTKRPRSFKNTILFVIGHPLVIDREALVKQGDNALGSALPAVRLVCLLVCMSALSRLNRLTFDLDFWCGGRL